MVVVGVRVRLGCGGGVQICRLWVALMVVLGDYFFFDVVGCNLL